MDGQRGLTAEENDYYSLSERVYAKFAPFYDLVTFPLVQLRREVAALAPIDDRSRVLDVATGTGAQARAFAPIADEVVGVDLSEAMLSVARRKAPFPNLAFRHADATELPFDDASFDLSCISFALHEMPPSVRERVLGEMSRVTTTQGTVLVVDYAPPRNAFERVASRLVRLYERDRYAEFLGSDLPGLMRLSGIHPGEEQRRLFGVVRIVMGSASEATRVGSDRAQGAQPPAVAIGVPVHQA